MNIKYIVLGILGFALMYALIIVSASHYTRIALGVKETGHLYVITVDDRNNPSTHTADSIISESDRCIEFRNEFGVIEKECGDRISKITLK